MYFIKIISLLQVLFVIDIFAQALHNEGCVEKIVQKARELKQEIDKLYEVSRQKCTTNASLSQDAEYESLVSDYLKMNFTLQHNSKVIDAVHQQVLASQQHKYSNHSSTNLQHGKETFLYRLKNMFAAFFGHKPDMHPEARLKRCLTIHLIDLSFLEDQIPIEDENSNLTSSDVQQVDKFLHNFIKCLNVEGNSNDEINVIPREDIEVNDNSTKSNFPSMLTISSTLQPLIKATQKPTASIETTKKASEVTLALDSDFDFLDVTETTTMQSLTSPQPSMHKEAESNSENFLRYLAHAQHSIKELSRPNFKPVDLQKVSALVDKMKHLQLFSFEDENETMKSTESNLLKRNIFNDLGEKVKKIKGKIKKKLWKTSREVKNSEFENRKLHGLFKDINVIKNNEFNDVKEDVSHEAEVTKPQKLRKISEADSLLNELNELQTKMTSGQQVEVSDFLEHMNDKPKIFKFDTSPYMKLQLDKIGHLTEDQEQQEVPNDEGKYEARKFFDFESINRKRSLTTDRDFQKIAKLKSKLIDEYRHHHPIIDYSQILRDIENQKEEKVNNGDEFIDRFYHLNDGSSHLEDVIPSHKEDTHVISPFELSLNFQLDDDFKELKTFDLKNEKFDPLDLNAPLYKPEIEYNKEVDDLLP